MSFNIIPPQVPFTTPDGRIAREWYLFLLNLFTTSGGNSVTISLDQLEALLLAFTRPQRPGDIDQPLREHDVLTKAGRGESSLIQALARRVQDLEQLVSATFGRQPTSPLAVGAPPTAKVGLAAVNGSASTFMLSDAAPALDQNISPTWTGAHTFDPPGNPGITINLQGTANYGLSIKSSAGNAAAMSFAANGNTFAVSDFAVFQNSDNTAYIYNRLNTSLFLATNSAIRVTVAGGGAVTVAAPSSGDALTLTNLAGANALVINGNAAGTPVLRANSQATTGAQTATFTATNKPGSGTTAPSKWLPVNLDGTTYYIPCWT